MTIFKKYTFPSVVISQPMYFPWIGMLQQIELADIFVCYDDVQFTRGFFNRVQIKTNQGVRWLTVPLSNWKRGQLINEVRIDNSQDWKRAHLVQLKKVYANAPFEKEMIELVDSVLSCDYKTIDELSYASTNAIVEYYYEIGKDKQFLRSSSLNIQGSSSKRLMNICTHLNAGVYITGHGARNYLDHEGFEKYGIDVKYVGYTLEPYQQLYGEFNPYVSALDLIANCGKDGLKLIQGNLVNWRNFVVKPQKKD
jgi:hypothetical protein